MSPLDRRAFARWLLGAPALAGLGACGGSGEEDRSTPEDVAQLARRIRDQAARSGTGPDGRQVYRGYRGLAERPWFEEGADGRLHCVAGDLPPIFDAHVHLGISALLAPDLDLRARTGRVRHVLDCDGSRPGCPLDLDVYLAANFREEDLDALRWEVLRMFTLGSEVEATHTIPNLLAEMDALGIARALVHPVVFGLPFGDDMPERFAAAVADSGAGERLVVGASVHPRDPERVGRLRRQAARGARTLKLHPVLQRFYPDDAGAMELYAECGRLGLVVFLHSGREGTEPPARRRYALLRGYEPALAEFPDVGFVLGHAGARDVADAVALARRHPNCWLDVQGQGVTVLRNLIVTLGPDRLLFGSDWPFYHQAATLAKVLLVTEGRPDARAAILHGNVERLLGASRGPAAMLPG